MSNPIRNILFSVVILIFYISGTTEGGVNNPKIVNPVDHGVNAQSKDADFCHFVKRYYMVIQNFNIPGGIDIHCHGGDGDDDVGQDFLPIGQIYDFTFCQWDLARVRPHICHFRWQQWEQVFDVHNKTMLQLGLCGRMVGEKDTCDWQARLDGFYWYWAQRNVLVKDQNWRRREQAIE